MEIRALAPAQVGQVKRREGASLPREPVLNGVQRPHRALDLRVSALPAAERYPVAGASRLEDEVTAIHLAALRRWAAILIAKQVVTDQAMRRVRQGSRDRPSTLGSGSR